MNRRILCVVSMAAVAFTLSVRPVVGQPNGKEMTVKGEVIDLWCYLEGGDHGAEHKDCATMCAKAGNPIGILDDKGNIYVVMGLKEHQAGKELLSDKMAETVTVSGTLVKKGGVQVIYVKSVK
jgi:hypothetical protein